jgi:DNA-binding PadR family transcriptional regulator
MHRHERFEEGPEWGRGRRGPRGGGWSGPPWAGPGEGPGSPDDMAGGPNRMWFYGGPFGPGAPGAQGAGMGRGWGRPGARPWGRARRGDVRSAILALLNERPMHGYEIIGELSDRTEGLWRPSPGSIYPTLQLLEDEGLVVAQVDDSAGKRRYNLTEAGQGAAAEVAKGPAPWEEVAAGAPVGARTLRHAVAKLMPVVGQVGMSGGPREYEEAAKVLDDARRRLYAILAGEQAGHTGPDAATSPDSASSGTSGSGEDPAN